MNVLMQEIRMTITKIKNLEKNKQTNNSEIIEVELKSERDKLNELLKIAKQEKLKATFINCVGYQERGGQAYGL